MLCRLHIVQGSRSAWPFLRSWSQNYPHEKGQLGTRGPSAPELFHGSNQFAHMCETFHLVAASP